MRNIRIVTVLSIALLLAMFWLITGVYADIASDLSRAKGLYESKDYDGAIQVLGSIESSDSAIKSKVMRLTGLCYAGKSDWQNAIESFSAFLLMYSNTELEEREVTKELGKCYQAMKSWDSAISLVNQSIVKYPVDAKYWLRRLCSFYSAKEDRVKEAETLNRLLNNYPDSPEAKDAGLALAECLCQQKKCEQGIAQLDRMLSQYPDMKDAIFVKKCALLRTYMNDNASAVELENAHWTARSQTLLNSLSARSTDTSPATREMAMELGKCYVALKSWDSAIAFTEQALSKYPMDTLYWLRRLSVFCNSKGDHAKEAVALQRLISEYPNTTEGKEANISIAECMCAQGKSEQAMAHLDTLLIQNPNLKESILIKKGDLMCRYMKDYDGAATVYSMIPSETTRMRLTDDMLLVIKQPMAARKMFIQLLTANPDSENAVEWDFFRGICAFTANDWATAREDFKLFYENHPSSDRQAQAKYYQGDCCVQMDDLAGARAAFSEIVTKFADTSWARNASKRLSSLNMEAANK